jgi:hypothetical protein
VFSRIIWVGAGKCGKRIPSLRSVGKLRGEEFRIGGEDVEQSPRAEQFPIGEQHFRLTSPASHNWKADGSASRATAKENVLLLFPSLGIAQTI